MNKIKIISCKVTKFDDMYALITFNDKTKLYMGHPRPMLPYRLITKGGTVYRAYVQEDLGEEPIMVKETEYKRYMKTHDAKLIKYCKYGSSDVTDWTTEKHPLPVSGEMSKKELLDFLVRFGHSYDNNISYYNHSSFLGNGYKIEDAKRIIEESKIFS